MKASDHRCGSGGPGRLDSDEIKKVLWREMLEKLISSACNFIFNAFWDP